MYIGAGAAGKTHCLWQRCGWVWSEERPSNNSENLFFYLVMAYSPTGKDVLRYLVYSLSNHGW